MMAAGSRVQFGVDVSEHQDGISLVRAAAEGIEFAVVRTTDGTYKDRTYRSHIDDASHAGIAAESYHYLRNPSEGTTIAQQVEASLEVMSDVQRPVWLDCETPAGLHLDHIREARDLFLQAGVPVRGIYTYPHFWRWRMLGADTREFGQVWLAQYGQNPAGLPAEIYTGEWPGAVGKQAPAMWQFSSRGHVAGFEVDVNARTN
ncbi:hypothetical protein KBX19_10045 [Corynebacterium sp. CCUG 71335]|nr:hypothetical protein [Corynebacterium sp. CCUG 71335]